MTFFPTVTEAWATVEKAANAVSAAALVVDYTGAAVAAEVAADTRPFDLLAILADEVPLTEIQLLHEEALAALRAAEERQRAAEVEYARLSRCPRCSGSGVLDGYRHHLDGICFRCDGTGQR